jgi:antitoxin component YwqK of YwqJK toxin-antitoxin module
VISDWDAIQAQPDPDRLVTTTKRWGMLKFAILLLAVTGGYWVYHLPVTSSDADYNADGIADEKWFYNHDRLARMEQDRNSDGKMDAIHYYDAGLVDYSEVDDNFDGVFESRLDYKNNLASYQQSDLDGDGQTDYQVYFRYGVLDSIVISGKNSAGKTARKQQVFQGNKLVSAQYDADGDGVFEKQYTYDFFEEPASNK